MNIYANFDNNRLDVKVNGEIDHHTVKEIREEVDRLIERHRPEMVFLLLESVDFMDSSGLGLILGRYKKIQEYGGELKLINPNSRVVKVLRLAGADKLVKIENIKDYKLS